MFVLNIAYRRRLLILVRPHAYHETNKEHKLTPSGNIVIATSDTLPSRFDSVLFHIKMQVAEFL